MSRSPESMSSNTMGKAESTLWTLVRLVLFRSSPSLGSVTWPLESRWKAYRVSVSLPLPGSP